MTIYQQSVLMTSYRAFLFCVSFERELAELLAAVLSRRSIAPWRGSIPQRSPLKEMVHRRWGPNSSVGYRCHGTCCWSRSASWAAPKPAGPSRLCAWMSVKLNCCRTWSTAARNVSKTRTVWKIQDGRSRRVQLRRVNNGTASPTTWFHQVFHSKCASMLPYLKTRSSILSAKSSNI